MNILYVVGRFPKVSETFVYNEVLGQLERGCDVRVLSVRSPEAIGAQETELARHICWQLPALPMSLRPLPTRNEAAVPEERLSRKLYAAVAARWARAHVLQGFRPDIIHAHFINLPTLIAGTLSAFTRVPYTFMAHSGDYMLNMSGSLLRRRVLHADAGFVVSAVARHEIQQRARLSDREVDHLSVVRAAVKLATVQRRKTTRGPFAMISVARLVPMKGIDTAIRSFAVVRRRHRDARFTIVGDGPERANLERLATTLGIADAVSFKGALDNRAAQKLISDADVAVLPSRQDSEGNRDGIPVSLMEAGALGVPVVSTPLSGIPELVRHRSGGLLVPPDSEGELARALLELAGDGALRERLGRSLQRRVSSEFSLDRQLDRVHAIWRTLLTPREEW